MKFKLIYLICFICCVLLTFSTVGAVDFENDLSTDDFNQAASISQSESSKTNLNENISYSRISSEDKDCVETVNELSNLDSDLNSIDSDEYSLKSSLSSIDSSKESSDSYLIKEFDNQKNYLKSSALGAGTGTFSDLKTLIENAKEKSTLNLDGKTFIGSGTPIAINKAITINGGSGMATFDGRQMSALFNIYSNNVHFINCRFINGINRTVYFFGNNSSVVNCSFEDNYQHLRTGVGSENFLALNCNFTAAKADSASTVMLCSRNSTAKNCNFINNTVSNDEGLQGHGAALQIGVSVNEINEGYVINCSFINNTVICNSGNTHAGALCFRPGIKVYNSRFINNYCNKVGGATTLHSDGEIINCTFINNRAGEYGGAISTGFDSVDISVNITGCTFINNSAPMGGAIQIKGNNVKVTNSKFEENKASQTDGGAVFIVGNDALIINSSFIRNSAKNVGAGLLINGSDVSVLNSSFDRNIADYGAGVYVVGSNANLFSSNFTGHNVKNGSVYIKGINAYVYDSNFRNNTGENGAGLFIEGSNTTLILSNFTSNNVSKDGGAVYIIGSGAKMISSEFLYNNAIPYSGNILSGLGGAVFIKGNNNAIDSSSFRFNTARNGSAIYTDGKNMVLSNTDFDKNQAWSYVLNSTVKPSISYFNGSDILINLTLVGGNNIANAIYNTASMNEIYFYNVSYISSKGKKITSSNEIHPVSGAENSKSGSLLYQDSREDNQLVNIVIFRDGSSNSNGALSSNAVAIGNMLSSVNAADGAIGNKLSSVNAKDIIFNKTLNTGILGNISLNLSRANNDLSPGNYILYAKHLEDDYYKEIDNSNEFEILPLVDLAVDISSSKDTVEFNKTNKFTIKLINYGPNDASEVKVNAVLPKGLILVSSNPTAGTYNASNGIWTIGNLKSGENQTLAINTRANATGLINYPVSVSSYEKDTNESNNKDNDSVKVPECDLAISVKASSNSGNYGEIINWTVEVENKGPDDASKIVISLSDLADADLTYLDSSNGSFNVSGQKLEIAKLNKGDKISFVISTQINASDKRINLNGNVTAETFEYNLNNNYDNDFVNVAPLCDLSIDVNVSNKTANANDTVKWTVTVKNDGPDKAKDVNVLISDLDEIGLIYINSTDKSYNPGTNEWAIGDLDDGNSRQLVIYAKVNSEDDEILLNSIVDTSTFELNKENNVDDDSLTVNPLCDVLIEVTASSNNANKNDGVDWTFHIRNDGPSLADDVKVSISDLESLGLIILNGTDGMGDDSGSSDADELSGLNYDPLNHLWTVGDLDSGEEAILVIRTKVNCSNEDLTVEGIVSTSTYELNRENNIDEDFLSVSELCDLAIAVNVSSPNANRNDEVDWTIRVSNNGPDDASDVYLSLSDMGQLGLIVLGSSNESFDSDSYGWNIGDLASGDSVELVVSTLVDNSNAELTVEGNVDTSTYELNKENNIGEDSLLLNPSCDLKISIDVSDSPVNKDDVVNWTITVVNDGPDNAQDVIVNISDLEQLGLIIMNASDDDFNPDNYEWIIGDLDNNENATLTITVRANVSDDSLDVEAAVDTSTFELDKENNHDDEVLLIDPLCDLALEIMVSNATANKGDTVEWTISVINNGPDKAQNAIAYLSDLESLNLEILDVSSDGFNESSYAWVIGDLGANESAKLILSTKINASDVSIVVDSIVETDTFELNKKNNYGEDRLSVNPLCDLALDIMVSNASANANDTVNWTVTVQNDGPDKAEDVIVYLSDIESLGLKIINFSSNALASVSSDGLANVSSDGLASVSSDGLANVSSEGMENGSSGILVNGSGNRFDPETYRWIIGDLNNGESVELVITTLINASEIIAEVNSLAQTDTFEPNKENNYDADSIVVNPLCDLSVDLVVSDDTVNKGDTVNWTVTIRNDGPDKAQNISLDLSELEPLGLIIKEVSNESLGDDGKWQVGDLNPGESIDLIITTQANASNISIPVDAIVDSDTYELDKENNFDNETLRINPLCDLIIDISVSNSSANKGDVVEWTITVRNDGPDDASDVDVFLDNLQERGLILLNCTYGSADFNGNADSDDSLELSENLENAAGDISKDLVYASGDVSGNILKSDALALSESGSMSQNTFNNETNQWHIGDLAKNGQIVLKLATELNKSSENITVPANVDTSTYEINKSNNYDEDMIDTLPLSDLEISIVPDKESAYVDDLVNWIITLNNNGPDNASEVNAYIEIPEGFELIDFNLDKGTLENISDGSALKLNWNISDLATNETLMLYLSTKALNEGVAMANVSVNSSTLDSNESNNFDYAAVEVIPLNEDPELDKAYENRSDKINKAIGKDKSDKINKSDKIIKDIGKDKSDKEESLGKSNSIPMKKTGNPLAVLLISLFALFSLGYRKMS